ncbi:hypothetical protein [Phocaeicola plebeius]
MFQRLCSTSAISSICSDVNRKGGVVPKPSERSFKSTESAQYRFDHWRATCNLFHPSNNSLSEGQAAGLDLYLW